MAEVTNRGEKVRLRRFRPYPEYRDSGVEWLGEIPANWEVNRLRTTVTGCQNGVWGEEADGVHDLICVRVADFDRVQFRVRLNEPTLRSIDPRIAQSRRLEEDDLLLEKSGGGDKQPVGAVVMYDHGEPAVCSNFVARMPVADDHNPRYLTYLHAALYAARINVRSIKQSTGIQNLDSESYLNESVAVPTGREQRVIAEFLDRETAKINALVAGKERLIELLQEKRTALITRAVTRGLDPDVPMKDSGVEWLGEIPAHWEVKSLSRKLMRITYGFTNPMPVADEGPYMLTALDIGDGQILYESARRTTDDAFQRALTDKSRPRAGDLLLTKDGTLGRIAVADGQRVSINQSIALLRFDPSVHVAFMQHMLLAVPYQDRMVFEAGGTTIKHIYISRLARMPVAIPPKEQEQNIIAYLSGPAEDEYRRPHRQSPPSHRPPQRTPHRPDLRGRHRQDRRARGGASMSFALRFTVTHAITADLTRIERARGFLEAATLPKTGSAKWVRGRSSSRRIIRLTSKERPREIADGAVTSCDIEL